MNHLSLKTKALGGAAALALIALATPAFAVSAPTTQIIAGGATFPEKAYRNLFNCYGNQGSTANPGDFTANLAPQTCNLVTAYNAAVAVFYAGVGSGNGKAGFVNHNNGDYTSDAANVCSTLHQTTKARTPDAVPVNGITQGVGGTTDFFGAGSGTSWVGDATGPYPGTAGGGACAVSFSGSDDPFSTGDMGIYGIGGSSSGVEHPAVDFHANYGEVIQVPMLIGAVAIPYHAASAGWSEHGVAATGNISHFSLSMTNLCKIMNGTIDHWDDASFKADNGGKPLDTLHDKITVIIRSDGSGTTFLHSNGLITQCAALGVPLNAAYFTAAGNSGGANNSFWVNVLTAGAFPANMTVVGAAGSGGVKAAVNGTAGAIGYVSDDFVHLSTSGYDLSGPNAANVKAALGTKFLAPTVANATHIMDGTAPPLSGAASCTTAATYAAGTSPDGVCAHNPINWSLSNPNPSGASAYALGGFTYTDAYSCYASATDLASLYASPTTKIKAGLFQWWFGTKGSAAVTKGLSTSGFAKVPALWVNGDATHEGILGSATGGIGLLTTDAVTAPAQGGHGICAGKTGA